MFQLEVVDKVTGQCPQTTTPIDGALFISAQLSTDAVSALRNGERFGY